MKGVILVNAYDKNKAQLYKIDRMFAEFANLGVNVSVVGNDNFAATLNGGDLRYNIDADFVMYFDKDKYVARMLEKCGVRLFNRAEATEICDDKMLTHITLANCGIPMPDTLPGALCYSLNAEISDEYIGRVVQKLGLPLVVKQCYGGFGEQVALVTGQTELKSLVTLWKNKPCLFQRYVSDSYGKDMRVIVIGGKVVCGMIRQNDKDFRSNVQLGGVGKATSVPDDIAEMCVKAAQIIGLDYCGVDVLLGEKPQICEVNSNAMFGEAERVCGVNVAKAYATHVVNQIKNQTTEK